MTISREIGVCVFDSARRHWAYSANAGSGIPPDRARVEAIIAPELLDKAPVIVILKRALFVR